MSAKFLASRRFLPLFITQFFGAFNDNFLKNAMLVLMTFTMASELQSSNIKPDLLTNAALALFIAPYIVFSCWAGQLADRYDRAKLTRYVKLVEIVLMAGALIALVMHSIWGLLTLLFLMGLQSTFFGPLKYSLLPQHLDESELVGGNGYISAGTNLAILVGSLGGVLVAIPNGTWYVGVLLLFFAIVGYLSSRWIPESPAPSPDLKFRWNIFTETIEIFRCCGHNKVVSRSILGGCLFWLVGALYLAQLPNYCKAYLGGDEQLFGLFLGIFCIGIGIGAIWCNRLSQGVVQVTFVPLGALGMAIFSFDMYFLSNALPAVGDVPWTLAELCGRFYFWRICGDLFCLAVSAGIYLIPLDATVQHAANPKEVARVIAGSNIATAVAMAGGNVVVAIAIVLLGVTIPQIFFAISVLSLIGAIYVMRLLPDALVRSIFRAILGCWFRVKVENLENFEKAGDRVMIIANHESLLDGLLVAAYLPEKLTFAIDSDWAAKWYVKPLLAMTRACPVKPASPLATRTLIKELQNDNKVMIFPEGRITVTGALMKIYDGPGMIADKSGATILPIRIDGAQYSIFSYLRHKLPIRFAPKITLTIMEPRKFSVDTELHGRARRQAVSDGIYRMMTDMVYRCSNREENLFEALCASEKLHGGKVALEDISRKPVTVGAFVRKSRLLGSLLEGALDKDAAPVGVMLPTSMAGCATFFALVGIDKVPAMINFSSGVASVLAACEDSGVKVVVTAHKFIEQGKLTALENEMRQNGLRIVYLEDVKANRSFYPVLRGMIRNLVKRQPRRSPESAAVILFTSGSEGRPKAVMLSHRNLLSNIRQVLSLLAVTPQDTIFNALPMFHSFGLGMGTLMPLIAGARVFFYPSPLHYRTVATLCYDTNATMLFGTDTFLAGYAKVAHPYDFFNLRFAVCGAERLRETTRMTWMDKFGVRLLEGYGTTEASPVLACNTPMYNRPGTVGKMMPGIDYRLEPVPGLAEGARLFVKGDNILMGYWNIHREKGKELAMPENGWYDTGDLVTVDEEGFITICGRAKRFAKLGGEMVSLGQIETILHTLYPDRSFVVTARPGGPKGEELIVLYTGETLEVNSVVAALRNAKLGELAIPKKYRSIPAIPLLGSGKTDYGACSRMVSEEV